MKYILIAVLMLLPFTAEAKPQPKPYKEWTVTVIFSTAEVKGMLRSCIHAHSATETIMEARELVYHTINGPHTVHNIQLLSGCHKGEENGKED